MKVDEGIRWVFDSADSRVHALADPAAAAPGNVGHGVRTSIFCRPHTDVWGRAEHQGLPNMQTAPGFRATPRRVPDASLLLGTTTRSQR